eukprot:gene1843-33261_t
MSDGGRSFEIALVSSQASPKHAELSCARLVLAPEMFGFKGDWMARDYLESGYSQRTSSNSFQQVYGFWSKKHIYEQLAKGNKDMKHDYSCFGKWEQDMASCIHFGPASVVFSPDRKLPSRDIRPWVEAFIELSLPSLVHGCGQFGMVTDRRLMRLQAVKKCSMCLTASYCSKECQTRDWKEGGHKARCKYLTTRGGLMAAVLKAAAVEEVK